MTWNCRVGRFRSKAAKVAVLKPDILVVPEVERLDGELFVDGPLQPTFKQRTAAPRWRRGLGVFSYTNVSLMPAFDPEAPLYGFLPYEARRGGLSFQIAAVWTYSTTDKATTYRQSFEGLSKYRKWIGRAPTVILGDFNTNATYSKGRTWSELAGIMERLDLVSVYHTFHKEEPGAETRPTYYHRAKKDSRWHVDYCFMPRDWARRVMACEVGTHEQWSKYSDHVPLIVDVTVPGS